MSEKPKKIALSPARPTIQTETFTVGPETGVSLEQYAAQTHTEVLKPAPPDKP